MSESGQVLMAGAGAVGSVLGGFLAAAGNQVTLLGRPVHMDAVQADGLGVTGLFGERRVRALRCVTDANGLSGPYETIFLTVKAYDTDAAVRAVAPALAQDGMLIVVQNGLGNLETAAATVGARRILGARAIFGAEVEAPGRVRVTVCADPMLVGSPDATSRTQQVAAIACARRLATAGIPAEPTDALVPALWAKLLYNAALNPLGAMLGVPYGDLPKHRDLRAVMDAVVEEGFAVAAAEGVALAWPDARAYLHEFYGRLVPATAGHRSSMLQDLERGRPTEIDAINGYLARRGSAHDLAVPTNLTLTRIIRARAGRAGSSELPCNT